MLLFVYVMIFSDENIIIIYFLFREIFDTCINLIWVIDEMKEVS